MTTIPAPGDRIGRFTIERELGAGGMGAVYLAHDTLLGIQVALKVLHPWVARGDALDRFKREVLLARRITHPGVCRIHDLGEEAGLLFITMEHVVGQSLQGLIDAGGALPLGRAGRILLGTCRGVAAAHRLEVVHRDLKPANILVRQDDSVAILDFGLAKGLDLSHITQAGAKIGTLCYMAPEILDGLAATKQSDIYSLGVTLYEALTGQLPYVSDNVVVLHHAIEQGFARPPSQVNPTLPVALDAVVQRAMAAAPDDRHPSATALRDELVAALGRISDELGDEDLVEVRAPVPRDLAQSATDVARDPRASAVLEQRAQDTTILLSDIVGITPYFERHGDAAGLQRLLTHNELLFPEIRRQGGRVIKTIGDAILACFTTAELGVRAAVAMQQRLAAYSRGLDDDEERLVVRVGLHSGESLFRSHDVFGNTVNLAARISARAQGGQILISQATCDELCESLHRARFCVETELKGLQGSFRLFSVDWRPQGERTETMAAGDAGGLATLGLPAGAVAAIERTQVDAREPPARQTPPGAVGKARRGAWPAAIALTAAVAVVGGGLLWALAHRDPGDGVAVVALAAAPLDGAPGTVDDTIGASAAIDAGVGATDKGERSDGASWDGAEIVLQDVGDTDPEAPAPSLDAGPVAIAAAKTLEQRSAAVRRELRRRMAQRGILAQDDPRLAIELGAFESAIDQGRHRQAVEHGRRCLRTVDRIAVDRSFVEGKLVRFNSALDHGGSRAEQATRVEWGQIRAAYRAGDYVRANTLLTRAFHKLEAAR